MNAWSGGSFRLSKRAHMTHARLSCAHRSRLPDTRWARTRKNLSYLRRPSCGCARPSCSRPSPRTLRSWPCCLSLRCSACSPRWVRVWVRRKVRVRVRLSVVLQHTRNAWPGVCVVLCWKCQGLSCLAAQYANHLCYQHLNQGMKSAEALDRIGLDWISPEHHIHPGWMMGFESRQKENARDGRAQC